MRKIRYAVVGLGDIAQSAILPAFTSTQLSELVALVSSDQEKLNLLSKRYRISRTYDYGHLEDCLMTGDIDAVYIALPNDMHREYTERSARKGVNVLCEKPMAPSSADCIAMIDAARSNNVKLMIAYRLHFDPSTLDAIELATSGKLGQLRIFSSAFSQVVKEGNIRVEEPGWMGGGSVWDMGIYCINAARYLLRDEPFEVTAFSENSDSQKFRDVDEMTSAIMRFHGYRLASFTSSFGASSTSQLLLVGDRGRLEIDSAYDYSKGHQHRITIDGETMMKNYPKVDQFSAEIDYFSSCIIENREPEPSGEEGLADVRVIEAVYQSAMSCRPIGLAPFQRQQRPSKQQVIQRPAHAEPERVKVSSPGK